MKLMSPVDNGTILRELENRGSVSLSEMCKLWGAKPATLRMQIGRIDRIVCYRNAVGGEMYKIMDADKMPKFITKAYQLPQSMKDQLARCAEARALPSLYAKLA